MNAVRMRRVAEMRCLIDWENLKEGDHLDLVRGYGLVQDRRTAGTQ
jgi:hypothetical protein